MGNGVRRGFIQPISAGSVTPYLSGGQGGTILLASAFALNSSSKPSINEKALSPCSGTIASK